MRRIAAKRHLIEDGTAPRVLVTDLDRFEIVSEGLYCFVCTNAVLVGRERSDRVDLYLDCTPHAISKGIGLVWRQAPALIRAHTLPKLFGSETLGGPH